MFVVSEQDSKKRRVRFLTHLFKTGEKMFTVLIEIVENINEIPLTNSILK